MKSKIHFASYAFLALCLFNCIFIMQIFFRVYLPSLTAEQWILVLANGVLFILSLFVIERKEPRHHSKDELTMFQFLFALLLCITIIFLLLLLILEPIAFMIFMPFEFFVVAFYIGIYFLLSRHILPTKK